MTEEHCRRIKENNSQIGMAPEPEDEIKDEKNPRPLDEDDIALLKTYVIFLSLSPLTFLLSISASSEP